MKLGFIGLGIMGKPMAKNLLKAGHELIVYGRRADVCAEMESAGARLAVSPAALAGEAEAVITMLPNTDDVLEIARDIIGGRRDAAPATGIETLIDMSSVSPDGTLQISRILAGAGIRMLDAPVSGGEKGAVDGTLSIMAGGPEELYEKYLPVLKCMGSSVVRVGDIGAGNVAKLANQMIVACTLAAASEAMRLARLYGVDENIVRDAIKGGMAGSSVMENKLPAMIAGNFKPGFRADLQIKDLGNAMSAAQAKGFSPILSGDVLAMLKKLSAEGYGGEDHSVLFRYYEDLK
jgi:2-hydroxy-3-oxopropionate reductase